MFRFGQWSDKPLGADGWQDFHDEARSRLECLSAGIVESTLRTFDILRVLWSPGGEFFARAVQADGEDSARSSEAAGVLLSAVPYMLSRERWEQRLRSEFADPAILDHPVPLHNGVGRVFPLGVVLHSLDPGAGLELIDSVLACLLTKNLPVLLVQEADRHFAALFLRSLEIADARGQLVSAVTIYCGRQAALAALRSGIERYVDATVDWRGAAARPRAEVNTYCRARAIHRSPPVLIAVISKAYWEACDRRRITGALVAEVKASRRSATMTLQQLYVEADLLLDAEVSALARAAGEALPLPFVQSYTSVGGLRLALEALPQPPTHCLCGLSTAERFRYVGELGRRGLRRFIPFEAYPERLDCRTSDGALLRELVHVVTDERDGGVRELLREAGESVPYYRERRPSGDISDLEHWPFLTSADLAEEPLHLSRKFLHEGVSAGSIFSSGGTSTAPKYALYTPPEITRSADMLARGFMANGLRPGDRVINLFIAGHLWSAFLAVDEALRRCGVYVLPMGGLSPIEEIVSCLSSFRPDVAFGLPSLLVGYVRHCEALRIDLTVGRIFYAGEHFNPSARDYVKRVWKTESFHSAGYAAVDVGAIGWQCAYCQGGEHHLFSNDVHLEIVDDEAVVTSLVRRAMPMIRYRTGDRVEWIASACHCGSREPRFRLLGRVDALINLWGCRVAYDDVERSLLEAGMRAPVLQLLIRGKNDPSAQLEQLIVRMEQAELTPGFFDRFIANLHRYSRDLSVALDVAALKERMVLECVPPNTIPRIARTGKVRLIVDERGSGQS